uniref:Ig-like domain-containing protein n=1 Tax=Sinocyclocheilus grahami TaxID=75366 RepID=A0A672K4Q7_SINGR
TSTDKMHTVDFSLVVSSGPVCAAPGEDVILPIHLLPETSAVSMEIRWFRGTELIYQYMNRQEMTNNDFENRVSLSIQELRRGNLALILRNVQPSDSGDYTCEVFHDGCQKRGVVHLQVRGKILFKLQLQILFSSSYMEKHLYVVYAYLAWCPD